MNHEHAESDGSTARPNLTIIVGPNGPIGEAMCAVLGNWAQSELIRLSYFVSTQEGLERGVSAMRLGPDGPAAVTLPADFGSTRWGACNFVLVQPVSPRAPGEPTQAAFARDFADFLQRTVLPDNTTLTKVNLVVPTSDVSDVDPGLLLSGWDLTLVASPEERASTDHPNVLVEHDRNLVGHTCLATTSVAGLWVGMGPDPLTHLVGESGSGEARPRVVRTFVRAVRGGDVTRTLADRVMKPVDGQWRVPASESRQYASAPDPGRLIERAVSELGAIDHGALEYGAPPRQLVPQKTKVGFAAIWASIVEFFGLLLRRVSDIPGRIVASAEARITARMFGAEGAHEFGFDVRDARDQRAKLVELDPADEPDASVLGQAELADKALAALGRTDRVEVARAQAWNELRQLCLGLVDGGVLPSGIQLDGPTAVQEVITIPSAVVPSSDLPRFRVPDELVGPQKLSQRYWGMELRPCDPLQAALLDRDLELAREGFLARAREESELAARKEQEVAGRQAELAAAADEQSRSSLRFLIEKAEAEAKQRRSSAQNSDDWAERIAIRQRELNAWAEPRLQTLMWRVGEHIGANLDTATIDLRSALAGVSRPVVLDVDEIERARRSVLRTLLLAVFLVGGASIAFGVGIGPLVPALAVGLLVLLVVTATAFTRYTRRKSAAEWRYLTATAQLLNDLSKTSHAAAEVSRLSTLYQLYVEWAEILGYHAHAPWTVDGETANRPPAEEVDVSTLPDSLLVGSSDVDAEGLEQLSVRAAREVQAEGWLGDMFRNATEFSMSRLAQQEGRAVADLDPDRDAPGAPNGAREFLLRDLRARAPQRSAYHETYQQIGSICAEEAPDKLFKDVQVKGGRAEVASFFEELIPDDPRDIPGMLVDLFSWDAQQKRAHLKLEPLVWAPNGVGPREGIRHRPAAVTRSGHYVLEVVRIDVARPVSPEELTIFAPAVTGGGSRPTPPSETGRIY